MTLSKEHKSKFIGAIDELVIEMAKIELIRAHMKEIYAVIKEEFDIPPKISRKIASIHFKQNLDEISEEFNTIEYLYDNLYGDVNSNAIQQPK